MKKLLLFLVLIPTLAFTQNDSWFKLEVQFDAYADDESFALITQAGDTLVNYQPSNPFEFYSTIVQADSGDLNITLLDDWGDGWQGGPANDNSNTIASIKLSNECQGTILDLDVTALGTFTQYDTVVNLLPCPPPVCNIINTNVYQQCLSPAGQALVVWEWENVWCDPVNVVYGNDEGWGPFYQGVNPGATNYGMLAGNGQMPPNWSVEFYFQVEFADGSLSDTITYTPYSCIEGCTDPTQPAYNPWATEDDGSCAVTVCDPATEYPITMEITLDNWPGETGWIMNSGGVLQEVLPGEYDYQDFGQTYIYNFCVSQTAGFELIVNDTYGDGMGGTAQSGPGAIVIKDCDGDTIWEMDNPNFGTVLYSGQQFANACPTVPDVLGCTDPDYQEYDPNANIDDGSCATPHILGCMDTNSINYDPLATKQEIIPVCDYSLTIVDAGGDGWGNSYLGVSQDGVPLGTFTMGPGPYEQVFTFPLDSDKEVEVYYFEVKGPQQSQQQVEFQTLQNSFKLENADSVILIEEGQNPFSNNGADALQPFEAPFFNVYVGQPYCGDICIPIVLGCMDPTALNYNPEANMDDPNNPCIPIVEGCTNPLAFNYNPNANVDDGSCIPVVNGCMDPNAYNYNPNANVDDGSCIYLGCMDVNACNFDSTANVDNGGCVFPDQYYDCNNVCLNDTDGDGVCDELEIPGCTDPLSINFNPNATDDDGSCVPIVYGCTDPTAFNYDSLANTDDGSCIPIVYGCTDPSQFNFDPAANTDDGSCVPYIYGCTDPTSFNYDPNANTDNGSCEPIVYGCTDSSAFNFNPLANTDDGTCYGEILGCTNPLAYNYNDYDGDGIGNILSGNPQLDVNTDDGSCVYDAGCVTGPGNPYWLNDQCYAWVIDVDSYCCENEWDAICQEMYNYCENGWPDGMDQWETRRLESSIAIYPNPTKNILNIVSNLDGVEYVLYDLTGKVLIEKSNSNQVDLTKFANGLYLLEIWHDGKKYRNKIIKE